MDYREQKSTVSMTVLDGHGRPVLTAMLSGDHVFPSWLTPGERVAARDAYREAIHRWVLEKLNHWPEIADA